MITRGDITVTTAPQIQVNFKNCVRFTKYIPKIDGTTKDDAENLDLVLPMFSLTDNSLNNKTFMVLFKK